MSSHDWELVADLTWRCTACDSMTPGIEPPKLASGFETVRMSKPPAQPAYALIDVPDCNLARVKKIMTL